jgi:hypothetical protein
MDTYVYFITGGGLTKIGVSIEVESRMKNLQAGSPVPLTLVGTIRGSWRTEKLIHHLYKEYRVHGEWFNFEATPEFVAGVAEWVEAARSRAEESKLRDELVVRANRQKRFARRKHDAILQEKPPKGLTTKERRSWKDDRDRRAEEALAEVRK